MTFFYFLISCFSVGDGRTTCTQTPVANAEVCHALIKATNDFANKEMNGTGMNYYPAFKCVRIIQK